MVKPSDINLYIMYTEIIKAYIDKGVYTCQNYVKSISDVNKYAPLFTFYGVDTWIFRTQNGKSYAIIWRSSDDWNLGYIKNGCSICTFRDVPKFI